MSQSRPEDVEHLNEQPWYDYQECLDATLIESRDRFIGEIFLVKIATNQKDGPVYHMFWALKICEGGPEEDRFRMCLYKKPLEHQRTLRGIESPMELTRITTRFRSSGVNEWIQKGTKFLI